MVHEIRPTDALPVFWQRGEFPATERTLSAHHARKKKTIHHYLCLTHCAGTCAVGSPPLLSSSPRLAHIHTHVRANLPLGYYQSNRACVCGIPASPRVLVVGAAVVDTADRTGSKATALRLTVSPEGFLLTASARRYLSWYVLRPLALRQGEMAFVVEELDVVDWTVLRRLVGVPPGTIPDVLFAKKQARGKRQGDSRLRMRSLNENTSAALIEYKQRYFAWMCVGGTGITFGPEHFLADESPD